MRSLLPRRRIWRAAIYIVSLLLVLVAIDLLLVEVRRKIRPGFATTRVVSPKLADGSVDFLLAIEEFFSEGVTPQNNAAPLILQALGRNALPHNQPLDGITQRLGMPHLPEEGAYFVRYADFCTAHGTAEEPDPFTPDQPMTWPDEFTPLTQQWIAENDKPLALLAEASRRSRFFIPFFGGHRTETVMEVLLPHLPLLAEARRPLLTRAVMRLNAGDFDGFRQDLLIVHRLARLVAQAPTTIERVAAERAIEVPACRVARAAATSGKLTSAQARTLAQDLEALGDLPPMLDSINISERLMALDAMQALARRGSYGAGKLLAQMQSPISLPPAIFRFVPVSYEKTMRRLNDFYDSSTAVLSHSAYPQRTAAIRVLQQEIDDITPRNTLRKLLSGEWAGQLFVPALGRLNERAAAARMERRLAQVALVLAAFKADRGQYPATLDDLSPAFLRAVPGDVFTEGMLKYSRSDKGYALYSVGPNMTDDGGNSQGDDIVVTSEPLAR